MGGKKVFELMLELGHKSQPLKSKLPNGYTHKWSVFVRGSNDSKIEHCIQRVVFQLHDSFPNPHREITEPPFQVKETGYAGFEIPIEIYFKNREKPNLVVFMLDLMLLTNKPNNLSRVEKIKFYSPHRDFEKCLIKSGAQLLSVTKDKKERSDSPPAKKQKSYSLIPSKDMSKQAVQQAQSHLQSNNHSHSSSGSLPSQNQLPPPSHSQQQQHHHKSKSSQLNQNHHGSYNNNSHSNNDQNNIGNHNSTSNSLFGNHTSHHSNHQSNHQINKQSSQQQSLLSKPKTSSRELMDVFGAPLVYNNNKSQKTSNGKDHSSDSHRDATTNNRSPIPPAARQPSPQVSTTQSHGHQSHSHHHKSSHHHHHHQKHQKHHHHQVKQEPIETLKTPPPPPTHIQASQKTPQKKQQLQQQPLPPPPTQAQAFVAQADPFQVMQSKISSLTDTDRLQKIVDIIEESGEWFNLTPNKFEFDLKRLDKKTLSRIEKCLP